ncbi:cyclopropane-fatty-acyl-phospholipid synthase family protein [Zoogloea sp.]|uniref:SAM-dependent methyltransferase n=1 Tax=Zoogloea sp. TaxID=49181 RepID=UPI002602D5E9|nr:cyclopropane-fatty-acyl-phospholipid synthase family protein [Zoogloea sp.]MDD3352293.1 cyclopropane-fatty-acyl-phospholipid synthase [Zoogloea sp.]
MNRLDENIVGATADTVAHLRRGTRLVLGLLDSIQGGSLDVTLPNGMSRKVGQGPCVAHMSVADEEVFDDILAKGDIGFAEAWMAGDWHTDNLPALLTLLARNRAPLANAIHGKVWRLLGHRLTHLLRANTRAGSKRNIEAHYDLGNDFYRLWLDRTMTYSSALELGPRDDLESAQLRKYRHILDQLAPTPGQTILEIGCGWGGFAEVATTEYGCRVLGLTLSREQLAWARQRAEEGGWADRADFELCDYRDVRGQYDHIVSIEMLEAVGERFWPGYFRQIRERLKPGGRAVIQVITIANELFASYRKGTDFIQRYVFPGGMLPSPAVFVRHARRAGLAVAGDRAFGLDYAETLVRWREGFEATLIQTRSLGYDERFVRLWRFYLAYCEAGFRAGSVDVHQFQLHHENPA